MRQALAFTVGFLPVLAAQQSYAQELPKFDSSNFQLVSLEGNSRAVAVSNGHPFYCNVQMNAASGYVLVSECIPFVGGSEAAAREILLEPVHRAAAEAKAVAEASAAKWRAEASAAAAEAQAEADAVAAKAEAEADAATVAERIRVLGPVLGKLTSDQVIYSFFKLARRDKCVLHYGLVDSRNSDFVIDIASTSGLDLSVFNTPQLDAFKDMIDLAMVELVRTGRLTSDSTGRKIIKGCD